MAAPLTRYTYLSDKCPQTLAADGRQDENEYVLHVMPCPVLKKLSTNSLLQTDAPAPSLRSSAFHISTTTRDSQNRKLYGFDLTPTEDHEDSSCHYLASIYLAVMLTLVVPLYHVHRLPFKRPAGKMTSLSGDNRRRRIFTMQYTTGTNNSYRNLGMVKKYSTGILSITGICATPLTKNWTLLMDKEELLKELSLQEKLAYFFCTYVHEEAIDPETDRDAVRLWEKITASRRKSRERVCILLNQMENTSAANVRTLDKSYRAKRELLLLSEGSLRTVANSGLSSSNRGCVLAQVEAARANNELLQECGALTVFTDRLQRSIHAFRGLNFHHLDLDQTDELISDLQQDMVLVYLLIVFNTHKKNAVFERQLMIIGIMGPSYALVSILDCLSQLNVLPGFPIKRLLLLFYEWFSAVLGNFDELNALKRLRRERSDIDASILKDDAAGVLHCKTFKPYHDSIQLDPQDPYYPQKEKFAKKREAIHNKYLHKPNYELKCQQSSDADLATRPLNTLDDEWEERVETLYQLFLPCMRDFATFLGNVVTLACSSASNVRDKNTFFSRRPSSGGDQYGMTEFSTPGGENNDNQFWKWILREKAIVLDVSNLIVLLIYKHFRASHACKAEYFMQFFLEANVLATLTKFMNKDVGTYLQVSRQDSDETKTGFYALEKDLDKRTIRFEEDMNEYSIQSTRTITSILRILQKLTKRKPNIIKNALCRGQTIVWLKVPEARVVALQIPFPRLYALKLVKSQAKYLGHQWVKKYTCFSLLTEVYLYVRPELDDGWLHYEDDDLNKPTSQDSVERIIFGEVQAYHRKHYFDSPFGNAKPLPAGASMICEDRKELSSDLFIIDGGRLANMYSALKLDPVNFSKQYEKWLDAENIKQDASANSAPLPVSFV